MECIPLVLQAEDILIIHCNTVFYEDRSTAITSLGCLRSAQGPFARLNKIKTGTHNGHTAKFSAVQLSRIIYGIYGAALPSQFHIIFTVVMADAPRSGE